MFTGIVEELGTVLKLDSLRDSARLTIEAKKVLEGSQIGDSIAVNGVCLTITELSPAHFAVDIMYETLRRTNLHELKSQARVNLERALQLQTRLGGHLVSGHVDGVGTITAITKVGIASEYRIASTKELTSYLIPKGSIAIDGISLTLVNIEDDTFSISLIPHTQKQTTLGLKGLGSSVNIETDLIGKYVAKFLKPENHESNKDISISFLTENGFI